MTQQPPNTRVRIYSHITQTRFLSLEDSLNIAKLRLFAGTYRRGDGMSHHAIHYLDLADARVIFSALAHAEPAFSYREYKGTPPSNNQPAVSRVLDIKVKGNHVYIELASGLGKLMPTGAIQPDGKPTTVVNIPFKLYEARRLAHTGLAYLHAWDILRMASQKQHVSPATPYLLVPTSSDTAPVASKSAQPESAATAVPPQSTALTPAQITSHKPVVEKSATQRPLTRKAVAQRSNGSKQNGHHANGRATIPIVTDQANKPETNGVVKPMSQPTNGKQAKQLPVDQSETAVLHYGDQTSVDMANQTEVQTYQRYLTDKQTAPASKAILLTYFQQQSVVSNAP